MKEYPVTIQQGKESVIIELPRSIALKTGNLIIVDSLGLDSESMKAHLIRKYDER